MRAVSEISYAPELHGVLAWLNVDRPLLLEELRGSLVILDFWTSCCVNCMHVIPTLRAIEERYAAHPVVVIGVHSGKFDAERDPERIRDAIGRYGVEHPVAVDDDFHLWSRYQIRSWPTLVVVAPDGRIAAVAPGEPDLATLDAFVRTELDRAAAEGKLAAGPPDLGLLPPADNLPLFYPGKAVVLPDGRLAISDSGHHRVIVCEADGRVRLTLGSGLRGLVDGAAGRAAFDDPQGLCFHDGALFVADTRNHALRRIDLESGVVTTVAGTGSLGLEAPEGRVVAREQALRSPWDLASVADHIYVAMAGSHQIWRFAPTEGWLEVYAGTGVEALLDGPVARSAWAQPSGLSHRDGVLYVADSESSAVRAIDLGRGEVETLVGQGLFDFGDGEGDAEAALLQHALGVAAIPDGVLIADTYNGKLKRWQRDPDGGYGRIVTELSGLEDPASVALTADGAWVIADTNAHRVIVVREGAVAELPVSGAPAPQRGATVPSARASLPPTRTTEGWFTTQLKLPDGAGLRPGEGRVELELVAPEGLAIASGSPMVVSCEVSRRSDLLLLLRSQARFDVRGGQRERVAIDLRITELPEPVVEAEIVVAIDYMACLARDTAVCTPGRLDLRVPVALRRGGDASIELVVPLPAVEL